MGIETQYKKLLLEQRLKTIIDLKDKLKGFEPLADRKDEELAEVKVDNGILDAEVEDRTERADELTAKLKRLEEALS